MRPLIVALTGSAGCGKSLAAEILSGLLHPADRVSFADPLRAMARALLVRCGYSLDGADRLLTDRVAKEAPIDGLGVSPRRLLQTLGTDWGRDQIKPDLWVMIWQRRTLSATRSGCSVITDDCRFPDEAERVRELGGLVIRLIRPQAASIAASDHRSEAGCGRVSCTIVNDGPREQLEHHLAAAISAHEAAHASP